jgi:nicotinamide mononucleotide adenylyltransferase
MIISEVKTCLTVHAVERAARRWNNVASPARDMEPSVLTNNQLARQLHYHCAVSVLCTRHFSSDHWSNVTDTVSVLPRTTAVECNEGNRMAK